MAEFTTGELSSIGGWRIVSQYACDCQVREVSSPIKGGLEINTIIEYCPKHKASLEMYEALRAMLSDRNSALARDKGRKALAKAEGKGAPCQK